MAEPATEQLLAGESDSGRRPGRAAKDTELTASFLVFRLGSVWYAVNALSVKKVVPWMQPVPVPGTPAFVRGVINSNGQVITVLDFAALLGGNHVRAGSIARDAQRCIVLQVDNDSLATLADEVFGLTEVPLWRVQKAATEGPVAETFSERDRVVAVVDVARLLALSEEKVSTGNGWGA